MFGTIAWSHRSLGARSFTMTSSWKTSFQPCLVISRSSALARVARRSSSRASQRGMAGSSSLWTPSRGSLRRIRGRTTRTSRRVTTAHVQGVTTMRRSFATSLRLTSMTHCTWPRLFSVMWRSPWSLEALRSYISTRTCMTPFTTPCSRFGTAFPMAGASRWTISSTMPRGLHGRSPTSSAAGPDRQNHLCCLSCPPMLC
mmetsp:Transcript_123686/g.344286  ORF Transcript_123686/g.344286 Transcript_123686/m.344286 type:complete len:200 (-) Transcript_123686:236-835(-)